MQLIWLTEFPGPTGMSGISIQIKTGIEAFTPTTDNNLQGSATFTTPFNSSPSVVVSLENNVFDQSAAIYTKNVTTTGFIYKVDSDFIPNTFNTSTPIIVDPTGNVGQYTSLQVVNGFPAISYYDANNGNLKYIRATTANGSAWGTVITVDSTDSVGLYNSLQIVNGFPAISYYDATNGDLKYVRALSMPVNVHWHAIEVSNT